VKNVFRLMGLCLAGGLLGGTIGYFIFELFVR
jgi:hypothetical protein